VSKGKALKSLLPLLLLLVGSGVLAYGGVSINRWVIPGGGGGAAGGAVRISGAVGQPVGGLSANGNTEICGGLWCGGPTYRVFIPLTLKDYVRPFPGPWEREPNNSYLAANGSIVSGQDYFGYPNDARDYFSFYMREGGTITIDLTGHTGDAVQLQLFYQSDNDLKIYDVSDPYHLEYTGSPGWYYVYIFAGGGYNDITPYTLRVTYPGEP